MATSRLNNRDRLFIRIAQDGTAIANSAIWRKHIPRGSGRWKDITSCVVGCCSTEEPTQDSFMIIQGTSLTTGTVTDISFPGYEWTGTIGNGDTMVIPLPYDLVESIVLTFSTITGSGLDINASTILGDGTITATPTVLTAGVAGSTSSLTITSTPGSQYLVTITDD